jgi:hypothetical protein
MRKLQWEAKKTFLYVDNDVKTKFQWLITPENILK